MYQYVNIFHFALCFCLLKIYVFLWSIISQKKKNTYILMVHYFATDFTPAVCGVDGDWSHLLQIFPVVHMQNLLPLNFCNNLLQ